MSELRPNLDDANEPEHTEQTAHTETELTEDQLASRLAVAEAHFRTANRKIWLGLLWWGGASAIIAISLAFSQTIHIFFGAWILAILSWFRAAKLFRQAKKAGAHKVKLYKRWPILLTAAVVVFSSVTIAPEYIHVMNPGVGTCWNTDNTGSMPVACFSPLAQDRAVALVANPDNCPAEATKYFEPDATEKNYTCLVSAH